MNDETRKIARKIAPTPFPPMLRISNDPVVRSWVVQMIRAWRRERHAADESVTIRAFIEETGVDARAEEWHAAGRKRSQ